MSNVRNIIKAHNSKVIKQAAIGATRANKECNCRSKKSCPVENKCLTRGVIYHATVATSRPRDIKTYVGLAGNTFKERYNSHTQSFRKAKYSKETELSKYIWKLKRKRKKYKLKWSIIMKSNTNKRQSGQCNLCLEEKYTILNMRHTEPGSTLNKRTELVSKCRHGNCRKKKKKS